MLALNKKIMIVYGMGKIMEAVPSRLTRKTPIIPNCVTRLCRNSFNPLTFPSTMCTKFFKKAFKFNSKIPM